MPMFLGVAAGNIDLARMAALETMNAYRTRNHADLIAVAQIIAFGLAALGSLSLSMADDISINMALRLRGNANALNRSAEQNRRAISQNGSQAGEPPDEPPGEPIDPAYEAKVIADLAATEKMLADARVQPTPVPASAFNAASTMTDQQKGAIWAAAMTEVAKEFTASLPNLPAVDRKLASRRIAALSSTASHLISGAPTPGFPIPRK